MSVWDAELCVVMAQVLPICMYLSLLERGFNLKAVAEGDIAAVMHLFKHLAP